MGFAVPRGEFNAQKPAISASHIDRLEVGMRVSRSLLCALVATVLSSVAPAQFVPGDLYVSAFDRIYHVDVTTWTFTDFADMSDGITETGGLTFSPQGTLLCPNFDTNEIFEYDAVGNVSTLYTGIDGLDGPSGVAFDTSDNLVVSNALGSQLLSFPAGGGAASVLADSGDGLSNPDSICGGPAGQVYVTDFYLQTVWLIDQSGNASVFDTLPEFPSSVTCRRNGDVYVAAGNTSNGVTVYRYPTGDASQRYVLVNFPNELGWGAVQLSLNQKTLYFASVEALYTIDSDLGTFTKVIGKKKGFFNTVQIAVYGDQFKATSSNFGSGFPGLLGVPSLTSQVAPVLGNSITVDLANSSGQATIGLFFLGTQQADLPTGFGGHLLLLPLITLPITIPTAGTSFSGVLPDDPRLAGTTIELQAVEADSFASKGVSFTQGLELLLGY